jgi:hypothetical protein
VSVGEKEEMCIHFIEVCTQFTCFILFYFVVFVFVFVFVKEGKRSVQQRTLFFMPHCGRQLYSNVLWANWSPYQLEKILILGNSFALYEQNMIGYKPNKAKYIFKVLH